MHDWKDPKNASSSFQTYMPKLVSKLRTWPLMTPTFLITFNTACLRACLLPLMDWIFVSLQNSCVETLNPRVMAFAYRTFGNKLDLGYIMRLEHSRWNYALIRSGKERDHSMCTHQGKAIWWAHNKKGCLQATKLDLTRNQISCHLVGLPSLQNDEKSVSII